MTASETRSPPFQAPLRLKVAGVQPGPLPVRPIAPSPCTAACPAGVNAKGYVSLIAEGRFDEALDVVRRRCPLPSVCGRVCHHPCEDVCLRSSSDHPVAIRALKRFVADYGRGLAPPPARPPSRGARVAVIGSGPAGLTAAYDLRLAGYRVTIFEAMPELGGMLRYGIADYRLPPDVLDDEIGVILAAGIEVESATPIRSFRQITDLLTSSFSAVLLAVGAQTGRMLGVEGEAEAGAVDDALSFLSRVSQGDRSAVQGKVVVVGGGSTAIEAARTALRLGAAPVEVVYRRSQAEMPVAPEELRQAQEEGVSFRFLASPQRVRLIGDGLELECIAMALGDADASGRRRPIPIPNSGFTVFCDRLLTAVGQTADLEFLEDSGSSPTGDPLLADPVSTTTQWEGIFATGDVVTGPSTVIEAIAAGHRAATTISGYLEGDLPRSWPPENRAAAEYGLPDPIPVERARLEPEMLGSSAASGFEEVEQAFTEAQAVAEASRCLRCGPCSECEVCSSACDRRHLLLRVGDEAGYMPWLPLRAGKELAALLSSNGSAAGEIVLEPPFSDLTGQVDLRPLQVRYAAKLCRGCALCLEVCQFSALGREDPDDPDSKVTFDATACRGCALCSGVCPTGALTPVAHTPDWWDSVLAGLAERSTGSAQTPTRVVLTCDTRVSEVTGDSDVIACRCVGQVHPGMLLDLRRTGIERITIAACAECRFGAGRRLAEQHVGDVRAVLRAIGIDPGAVALLDPVPAAASETRGARQW